MRMLSNMLTMYLLSDSPRNYISQHKEMQKGSKPAHLFKVLLYSKSGSSSDEYVDQKANLLPRIKRDGDFKDLVTQSTIFADKSLLIKDIVEDSDTTLLLAMPRRWGKTVNLDMLKRFLEIPVDTNGKPISRENTDNYQIFHRKYVLQPDGSKSMLKISQSKILIQDPEDIFSMREFDALDIQGTYPVIYIDFKNCKADDYNSIEELVRAELSESFSRHAYLQDSTKLSSHQRRLIKQYIEESEDTKIVRGLKVLSKALHDHHEKKVWILIDEYDAVANIAYREFDKNNLDKTIKLFLGIYEIALKTNSCLEKGVLTGVQYIAQSGMLSGLSNLGKFDFTNAKYAQHYGLDQNEVDFFFDHFSVPKIPGNMAKLWYNGYKVKKYCPENPEVHLKEIVGKYNIWSIISYLKEGDFTSFKSYWEKSGNINFMDDLFTKPEVREQVEKLVDGESIYLVRKDDFSVNDFKQLKNMIGGNKEITPYGLSVLFSYLFIGGYLTIGGKMENYYQLPNMEITYEMRQRLIDYYKTIYTLDPTKIQDLTDILQNVMNIKTAGQSDIKESFKNFHNKFKEMIQDIRLVDNKNDEGIFTNEDIIHSILNYIVLQTQHSTFGSEIYTNKLYSNKKGRADIKITNEDVGIIVEVKCVPVTNSEDGQHMKEAIEQAISYKNLLNTSNNIFVAINVDKKMKTPEEGSIELLCASDMFNETNVFGIDVLGSNSTFGISSDFMESLTGDA